MFNKVIFLVLALVFVTLVGAQGNNNNELNALTQEVASLAGQLAALTTQWQNLQWEMEVRQAQAVYNFHLDRLFDIACVAASNASALNANLNLLMESFCPDMNTWTAATPYVVNGVIQQLVNTPPAAVGWAATRAEYSTITTSGTFGCGSQHNVINPVITFSTDHLHRPTATLTARLWQFALFGSTNTWADIMGWYQNVWTLENGKWCMSTFFAANDIIVVRDDPGNDNIDTNVFAFAQGTSQMPPLPTVVPSYVDG